MCTSHNRKVHIIKYVEHTIIKRCSKDITIFHWPEYNNLIYIYIYIYKYIYIYIYIYDDIVPLFLGTEDDMVSNILVWFSVFCKVLNFFLWIPHRCCSGVFLVVHEFPKLILRHRQLPRMIYFLGTSASSIY